MDCVQSVHSKFNELIPNFESKPISNFDDLQKWTAKTKEKQLFDLIPDLQETKVIEGPKVLLCHDMKGGYLADRFVNGCDDKDSYTFFHWSFIDVFVYFSHNLVTIPPCTWVTAAHRNGVPVLGTFITEGEKGYDVCRRLLSSVDVIESTAKQLADICGHYKFEGWLINIENAIESENIDQLVYFVTLLTKLTHERNVNSKVIWYDSVIHPSGELCWQNQLNSSNIRFFDACDGIYLNYCWSKSDLVNSFSLARQSNRQYDVYVGVDVFGRGCYGGGGMNTNVAVQEIKRVQLSIALFAPGWVHEVLGSQDFHENQLKFWSSLELNTRRLPVSLPFQSHFCRGFGKYYFRNGNALENKTWFNLMYQEPQIAPNIPYHLNDAVNGGGCLIFEKGYTTLIESHIEVPISGCIIVLVHKMFEESNNAKCSPMIIAIENFGKYKREQKLYPLSNDSMPLTSIIPERTEEQKLNGWITDNYEVNHKDITVINKIDILFESRSLLGEIKILERS